MIRHLFKIIWNKRKQNFLMMTEILVSFLVLFAVFTVIVFNVKNGNRPTGFDPQKVWAITFQLNNVDDTVITYHESIEGIMKSLPEVESVAWTSHNFPYAASSSGNTTNYNKVGVMTETHEADDTYARVLGATVIEGRWYGKQDDGLKHRPVVINESLKAKLFRDEQAVGKVINANDKNVGEMVVGVVANMKDKGDYEVEGPSVYKRIHKSHGDWWANILLVKFKEEQAADFEAKLHRELSRVLKGANIEIEYLKTKRTSRNNVTLVPQIILIVVCSFLVLNVSLGLFGVLWYNINRRKGEIGLRRAIGASGSGITKHFMMEAVVLTCLATVIGFFFAVQFPLLNVFDIAGSVYLTAILLAMICIFLLVLVCSFYPGRQAAGIYPAVALHEN